MVLPTKVHLPLLFTPPSDSKWGKNYCRSKSWPPLAVYFVCTERGWSQWHYSISVLVSFFLLKSLERCFAWRNSCHGLCRPTFKHAAATRSPLFLHFLVLTIHHLFAAPTCWSTSPNGPSATPKCCQFSFTTNLLQVSKPKVSSYFLALLSFLLLVHSKGWK